jgi:hypothetical protein
MTDERKSPLPASVRWNDYIDNDSIDSASADDADVVKHTRSLYAVDCSENWPVVRPSLESCPVTRKL